MKRNQLQPSGSTGACPPLARTGGSLSSTFSCGQICSKHLHQQTKFSRHTVGTEAALPIRRSENLTSKLLQASFPLWGPLDLAPSSFCSASLRKKLGDPASSSETPRTIRPELYLTSPGFFQVGDTSRTALAHIGYVNTLAPGSFSLPLPLNKRESFT